MNFYEFYEFYGIMRGIIFFAFCFAVNFDREAIWKAV